MTGTGEAIRAAITEALSDGAWHDLIEVLHVGMRVVPPGEATRRNESDRLSGFAGRGMPVRERIKPMSLDRQVLTGQRALAREQLGYMYQTGKIEMDHYPSREDWRTPGRGEGPQPRRDVDGAPEKDVRAHKGVLVAARDEKNFKRFKA